MIIVVAFKTCIQLPVILLNQRFSSFSKIDLIFFYFYELLI